MHEWTPGLSSDFYDQLIYDAIIEEYVSVIYI